MSRRLLKEAVAICLLVFGGVFGTINLLSLIHGQAGPIPLGVTALCSVCGLVLLFSEGKQ